MSRPGLGKVLIILLIVVIVALIGASAFWVMSMKAENTETQKVEIGPVYETEEYTVNIANTLNHFIKAKFAIELSNEEALHEVETKLPIIQDTIIMVLSGQDLQTLSTVEGKEKLKENILNSINDILEEGQANKIYYKNIIFQ